MTNSAEKTSRSRTGNRVSGKDKAVLGAAAVITLFSAACQAGGSKLDAEHLKNDKQIEWTVDEGEDLLGIVDEVYHGQLTDGQENTVAGFMQDNLPKADHGVIHVGEQVKLPVIVGLKIDEVYLAKTVEPAEAQQ
jgi:hypothetical protein